MKRLLTTLNIKIARCSVLRLSRGFQWSFESASLTILDRLPKKKKNTLKVTKLPSCMNFRMIQVLIKCFERPTVERIEENTNDLSRCFIYTYDIKCKYITAHKYGHGEMRNKKLINRRSDITQGWQFWSP